MFILLLLSPNILLYLSSSIILIFILYCYPYYIDHWVPLILGISLCYSINAWNYWIRDSIREYTSTYMSMLSVLSFTFLGIIASEIIFFVTLFWLFFQPLCSYLHSLEGIYTSDPNILTMSNTIILSSSSISYTCTIVIRDINRLQTLVSTYVIVIALTFLHLQIKEFLNLTLYMNESIYVSVFYSILGLHFIHVIIGIVMLILIFWSSSYSRSISNFIFHQMKVSSNILFTTLQSMYWHFVDILWLFIYYILYN